MPFHEKSAWIMTIALVLGGVCYFAAVASMSSAAGELVPPVLPTVIVYSALLTAVAIAGHVVAAIFSPKEANAPIDEREKLIVDRAGHWASYLLGVGVLASLGVYLVSYDGDLLFYGVFASLMLSQLAEYALQIFFHRSAF